MYAKVTNTSRANQGVWTVDGLKFVEPGKTLSLTIAPDYVERAKSLPFLKIEPTDGASVPASNPLDHDGDGKAGGAANTEPLTDAEEIELIGAMTDDELRDFIERKTGKKPHHKAGHDKLVALATEAAKG